MTSTKSALSTSEVSEEKSYVSQIHDLLSSSSQSAELVANLTKLLFRPDKNKTRVFYTNGKQQPQVQEPSEIVAFSDKDHESRKETICVIENISPAFIEELGSAWDLDPVFFIGHAQNPHPEDLWAQHSAEYDTQKYRHLDGIFVHDDVREKSGLNSSPNYFPRHCIEEPEYTVQSNTRISYYRVRQGLYLFLVDAVLDLTAKHVERHHRRTTTLRLTYATNRRGLVLPPLFSRATYSLFDSFEDCFQHGWHFRLLFDNESGAIPGQPLLYILSNSLWESNLRYLTKNIHRISFEEVPSPNFETNIALHDRRESLTFMKSALNETIKYVPSSVANYFNAHPYYIENIPSRLTSATPIDSHKRILDEGAQLDRFLMETFQLLMSSISIRDVHLSTEQSQRGIRLTQLAFIYAPLSFVTGIFGMNVKEINATGSSIWVCLITFAIVAMLTAGIFWLLHVRRDGIDEGRIQTQV